MKLNVGSGQRRFDTAHGWVNLDCVHRPPAQVPDVMCNVSQQPLPFRNESVDVVAIHHMLEHLWHSIPARSLIAESHRVLKPGGSLLVFVPDMRALAKRWLLGQISSYTYFTTIYGAYQGDPTDFHRWGFDHASLLEFCCEETAWRDVRTFDWREIPGAAFARDWWVCAMEAVK